MAYLPHLRECKNGCGASIYFDRDSKVSHPSQDKWVPLEYNEDTGVYTGEKHNCPKYSNGNGSHIKKITPTSELTISLDAINAKLDKLLSLLEKENNKQ